MAGGTSSSVKSTKFMSRIITGRVSLAVMHAERAERVSLKIHSIFLVSLPNLALSRHSVGNHSKKVPLVPCIRYILNTFGVIFSVSSQSTGTNKNFLPKCVQNFN